MKQAIVILVLSLTVLNVGCGTLACSSDEADQAMKSEPFGYLLHWASFPIHVDIDRSSLRPEQILAAETAMDTWNDATGQQVFDYQIVDNLDNSQANVKVYLHEVHPGEYAHTNSGYDPVTGFIGHTAIEIAPFTADNIGYDVLTHEFGHVLGLAHDEEDQGSLMWPYTFEGRQWEIRSNDLGYVNCELNQAAHTAE